MQKTRWDDSDTNVINQCSLTLWHIITLHPEYNIVVRSCEKTLSTVSKWKHLQTPSSFMLNKLNQFSVSSVHIDVTVFAGPISAICVPNSQAKDHLCWSWRWRRFSWPFLCGRSAYSSQSSFAVARGRASQSSAYASQLRWHHPEWGTWSM